MKMFRLFSMMLLVVGVVGLQGMEKFPIQQLPQGIRLEVCKNLRPTRTRYIDIVAFFKALQAWKCTCKEWNTIAQHPHIQELCIQLKKLIADNSKGSERGGRTPLHDEISRLSADHTVPHETLIQLLESGANINKGDKLGEAPLYTAAALDQEQLGQILLDYGADIDQTCEGKDIQNGWTPLHIATKNGWVGMVKFLLAHGADVTKTTKTTKKTAFALAFERNHTEIANLLAEAEKEQIKKQQEKEQQATTEPDESRLQKIVKLTKNIFSRK